MAFDQQNRQRQKQAAAYRPSRSSRFPTLVLVAILHVAIAIVLVRMFAPGLASSSFDALGDSLTVTFTQPAKPPASPTPSAPEPQPGVVPKEEGKAAEAAKAAKPRAISAPQAPIVLKREVVPPVSGPGKQLDAGAADAGEGTGAQGQGSGTGAGRSGLGRGGGGGASPTVKTAGDINSARDYPRRTRNLRIGHSVIIDLRVGIDGRASNCRIVRASPDPEADRITCQLALERFRFRPATNGHGEPVAATYRWQQRWFVN